MAYKDIREYMEELKKEGELIEVGQEVDWNLEVGAIIRRACELRAPAPFFKKIKDYPVGYGIAGALVATKKRVAIALDMNPNSHEKDIREEYLRRKKNPIKPIIVSDGPCKENIYVGEEVDLLRFPVPYLHEGDGGRYLCTWHVTICKDPDSDWVNWGMYRAMVYDGKTMGSDIQHFRHAGIIYHQKYEARGKPMPFAIAIGCEPISEICASTTFPLGVSEADIAGALRQEPLELVKCETNDLYVPATAEIVLEGEILPNERRDEGPFGEFPGYLSPVLRPPRPVHRVKAITHRNNPILTVSCMGMPVDDSHAPMSITLGAELLEEMRAKGLPVNDLAIYAECSILLTVISVKVTQANIAQKIADCFWSSLAGNHQSHLIIVEDDVDPFNKDQVLHAFATKCHPARGIIQRLNTTALPLVPFLSPEEKIHAMGAKVYFDCTWPAYWDKEVIPKKAAFDTVYPEEIRKKVLNNWHEYGY